MELDSEWQLCFILASSSSSCLLQVDLHLNPAALRSAAQAALDLLVQQMGRDYRNPNIPPFHTEPLVQAYNACVPPALQLPLGQPHDAVEFLAGGGQAGHGGLLGELRLAPHYLLSFMQEGTCNQCGHDYQQVSAWDSPHWL